ncbi:MAG: hypothetical protein RL701_828 [Pseudomonadota bacterium]
MLKNKLVLLGCVASLLSTQSVQAGTPELFNRAILSSAEGKHIFAPYVNGGGGMFVSSDGGENFGMLCASAIDPSLVNDALLVYQGALGQTYVGSFEGVWRGDNTGCGFVPVPELTGHFIGAITGDPLDPERTYVGTSDADPNPNGIFLSKGKTGTFEKFGVSQASFIETLHVVKHGEGRRFWETTVKTDVMTNVAKYIVRFSDDDAKTWTEYEYNIDQIGPKVAYPDFRIVAVDPTNEDHLVGVVTRNQEIDSLVYSLEQGKPGTWKSLADVNTSQAVQFTPDGTLYFGDSDQVTKSFYVAKKLGDAPTKLSDAWKVSCLQYDNTTKTMWGCSDLMFGTIDTTKGELKPLIDMRCGERFVDCPGKPTGRELCASQIYPVNYCDISHFPAAPLCAGFDNTASYKSFIDTVIGYSCVDGFSKSWPDTGNPALMSTAGSGAAGTSAEAGAGGGTTTTTASAGRIAIEPAGVAGKGSVDGNTAGKAGGAAAGSAASAAGSKAPAEKSGCHVSQPTAAADEFAAAGAWSLLMLGFAVRVRRRRSSGA